MIATRRNLEPLIEDENVTSNDRNAKRFASTIRPTPAVHLSSARPRTRLRKTNT
jgi:hypothetical protein